jgi:predicted metal-dependent phosphoesterase TrpH|tara:strand:+ start:639 stop:839 length:201 start_codon:yes stop_codon:yes gene_type:complete
MKIVTHKFRIKEDQTCYLVNLVDYNGHPLESKLAYNSKEKVEVSEDMAKQHKVQTVFHNSGFSIIE